MASILVVEDAAFTRRMICKILQAAGHTIREATNGWEGLETIATYPADCILLDLLMPDMDGWEFLRQLNSRQIDVPVIVITADIQRTSQQQCLDLGAFTVLGKPPAAHELNAAIHQALQVKAEQTL